MFRHGGRRSRTAAPPRRKFKQLLFFLISQIKNRKQQAYTSRSTFQIRIQNVLKQQQHTYIKARSYAYFGIHTSMKTVQIGERDETKVTSVRAVRNGKGMLQKTSVCFTNLYFGSVLTLIVVEGKTILFLAVYVQTSLYIDAKGISLMCYCW